MKQSVRVVPLLIALMGCSGTIPPDTGQKPAWTSADSWFAPPSDREGFVPLDGSAFAVVLPDLQAEAQAALSEVAMKRLTHQEATWLVGRALPGGAEPVLLRGVALSEGTGTFRIFEKSGNPIV